MTNSSSFYEAASAAPSSSLLLLLLSLVCCVLFLTPTWMWDVGSASTLFLAVHTHCHGDVNLSISLYGTHVPRTPHVHPLPDSFLLLQIWWLLCLLNISTLMSDEHFTLGSLKALYLLPSFIHLSRRWHSPSSTHVKAQTLLSSKPVYNPTVGPVGSIPGINLKSYLSSLAPLRKLAETSTLLGLHSYSSPYNSSPKCHC